MVACPSCIPWRITSATRLGSAPSSMAACCISLSCCTMAFFTCISGSAKNCKHAFCKSIRLGFGFSNTSIVLLVALSCTYQLRVTVYSFLLGFRRTRLSSACLALFFSASATLEANMAAICGMGLPGLLVLPLAVWVAFTKVPLPGVRLSLYSNTSSAFSSSLASKSRSGT